MRIATWNINSVRLRIDLVRQFVESHNPDVLCLQETKAEDKVFPLEAIQAMGYPHCAFRGMKGYNGVAILSRLPLSDESAHEWVGKSDARHVAATLSNGIEVHSLYVPAGGDEPDPAVNEKFAHKLGFVDELAAWFPANRSTDKPILALGDFNIAPLETDVWSHKKLLKVVSHTPIEVEKLNAAQTAFDWVDTVRNHFGDDETLYSWWSYRARDWRAANKGRRLDHIWATPAMNGSLGAVEILTDARGWEKPSDHVPVILDIAD